MYLIGIAGGSGSGKTTFADKILSRFSKGSVGLVHQDNYYLDHQSTTHFIEGKPNFNVNFTHLFGELSHKLRTTTSDELRIYRKGANTDSLNPYLDADNDYQDLLLRVGNKNVLTVSASGGQSNVPPLPGL